MRSLSSPPALKADHGCVVSYCPIASALGNRMLEDGGNAVDAAVATALGLAVTLPQAGNIGGGGFMLIRLPNGESHALDYREVAPRELTTEHILGRDGYRGEEVLSGAHSVAVPGTVAGLAAALARFGRFSWDRVVGCVIDVAERGVWLTTRQAMYLRQYRTDLGRFPSTRRIFTRDGAALQCGTAFIQTDLAATLRELANNGPRSFYAGAIADKICRQMTRDGGVLDAADLETYAPRWRDPEVVKFAGRQVLLAPLPSGGSTLSSILTFMERLRVAELADPIARASLLARIFKVAFFVRRAAGDPDHDDGIEEEFLEQMAMNFERLEEMSDEESAVPSARVGTSTTHFCTMDGEGCVTSNTYSLNNLFGSRLVVDGAGFILNNSIDDFALTTGLNFYGLSQGTANALRGGRRPLSSMCPAIVLKGDRPEIVLGGSGGPRIPTMLAQVILSSVVDGAPIHTALRQPRVHHQHQPPTLYVENHAPPSLVQGLVDAGHPVSTVNALGVAAAIHVDEDKSLRAALDVRVQRLTRGE